MSAAEAYLESLKKTPPPEGAFTISDACRASGLLRNATQETLEKDVTKGKLVKAMWRGAWYYWPA